MAPMSAPPIVDSALQTMHTALPRPHTHKTAPPPASAITQAMLDAPIVALKEEARGQGWLGRSVGGKDGDEAPLHDDSEEGGTRQPVAPRDVTTKEGVGAMSEARAGGSHYAPPPAAMTVAGASTATTPRPTQDGPPAKVAKTETSFDNTTNTTSGQLPPAPVGHAAFGSMPPPPKVDPLLQTQAPALPYPTAARGGMPGAQSVATKTNVTHERMYEGAGEQQYSGKKAKVTNSMEGGRGRGQGVEAQAQGQGALGGTQPAHATVPPQAIATPHAIIMSTASITTSGAATTATLPPPLPTTAQPTEPVPPLSAATGSAPVCNANMAAHVNLPASMATLPVSGHTTTNSTSGGWMPSPPPGPPPPVRDAPSQATIAPNSSSASPIGPVPTAMVPSTHALPLLVSASTDDAFPARDLYKVGHPHLPAPLYT
jgi:hypothetical protein